MDILQVSGLAIILLSEFLKSAVSEAGKKVIGSLLDLIKTKIKGNQKAERILNDFQEAPDDDKKRSLLIEQLKIEMLKDKTFAFLISEQVNSIMANRQAIFNNNIDQVNTLIQINTLNGDLHL